MLVPVPSTRISLICELPPSQICSCHTRKLAAHCYTPRYCAYLYRHWKPSLVGPLLPWSRLRYCAAAPFSLSSITLVWKPGLGASSAPGPFYSPPSLNSKVVSAIYTIPDPKGSEAIAFFLVACARFSSFVVVVFLNRKETAVDC
jgi:hypothetical protein